MRYLEFVKRVVPFVLTFALGLSVAGIFYAFTSVNADQDHRMRSFESSYEKKVRKYKKKKKKKKRCRKYRRHHEEY